MGIVRTCHVCFCALITCLFSLSFLFEYFLVYWERKWILWSWCNSQRSQCLTVSLCWCWDLVPVPTHLPAINHHSVFYPWLCCRVNQWGIASSLPLRKPLEPKHFCGCQRLHPQHKVLFNKTLSECVLLTMTRRAARCGTVQLCFNIYADMF